MGSPVEAGIRWYVADHDALPLRTPSVIVNSDWEDNDAERDYGFNPANLGEVRDAPRPAAWADMPQRAAGLGPCGNPRWFAAGVPVDPTRPPTVYTADGLSVCCRPGRGLLWGAVPGVPRGGLLWASVVVTPPAYCAAYQVNPPFGVTMVHPPPGLDPYLWSQPGAGLPRAQLEAPEYPGGDPDTWYFRVLGTGFVAVTTAWDGTGVRAFDVLTPPGSTINIGCV